jgi:PAS domain S-box-containing protein
VQRLKAGQSSQEEYRLVWPDGSVRWVRDSVVVSRTETGLRLDGILTDVTRRKAAQEALVKERALLRTLIDNLPDLIYIKDTQGRYLLDNLAHQRFLGAANGEEVAGKTIMDFLPADIASKHHERDIAVMRAGREVINNEEEICDREGRTQWFSTTQVPLRDAQGRVNGMVCLSRDLTLHKEAEVRLQKERNLLHALMDNSPDHIYFKNLDSSFIRINKMMAFHFGLDAPAGAVGKSDNDFSLPSTRAPRGWTNRKSFAAARPSSARRNVRPGRTAVNPGFPRQNCRCANPMVGSSAPLAFRATLPSASGRTGGRRPSTPSPAC